MNIALLEDDQAVCEYVATALGLIGHKVFTYTMGASLLAVLSADAETISLPYDLVIMDLHLPGDISGQEIVMRIHSNAATKRLPILIISGTHESELARVNMRFPSIPILRKPFKFQDLIQFIDKTCSTP